MHASPAQSGEQAEKLPAARSAQELVQSLSRAGIAATILGDATAIFRRLANFDEAKREELTFIRTEAIAKKWNECGASIALISQSAASSAHESTSSKRALIVVPDADLALNEVLKLLTPAGAAREPGVHATATVHHSVKLGAGVHIGPHCVIEENAVVADGAVLLAGSYVGPNAHVGAKTLLHPGVKVLERCRVGSLCILHSGVVIGADGFGYRPAPDGRGVVKVPHIGDVVIGDDVEIGANSCVDRAKFGSTTIGSGTKIDNLVQIAHNCRVGRCCIICGQAGLAGSVTLGDGVMLGAKAAIVDNVSIGSGAKVAAAAGVISDIPAGAAYMGSPAVPATEAKRAMVQFMRMGRTGKKSS